MDLPVCLTVGAPDDVSQQGALFSNLPFDHQPNVYVVKHDELSTAFQVGLHRLVFIHRAGQAEGQEPGEGKSLTGVRFVFRDELPADRYVHFQQPDHAMLRPGQVEHAQPHAARRWEIDDMIGSNLVIQGILSSIRIGDTPFFCSGRSAI